MTARHTLAFARRQHRTGNLDAAAALYRDVLAEAPDNAEAHHGFAVLLLAQGRLDDAAMHGRRAAELLPDDAEPLNTLGVTLKNQGRFADAAACYERALALDPCHAGAHNNLGIARMVQDDLAGAVASFDAAVAAKPGFAEAHTNRGIALRRLRRIADAADAFAAAVRAKPDFAPALAALADLYSHDRRTDEARQMAERALAADPGNALARIVLARLARHAGDHAAARASLEALLRQPLADEEFAAACAELGFSRDRLKDPAGAFAAFADGQRRLAELPQVEALDRDRVPDRIARLREVVTAAEVARWTPPPADGLPDPVFLVGFPRSGTTLTEQLLASHPGFVTLDERPLISTLREGLPRLPSAPGDYPEALARLTDDDLAQLRRAYWSAAGGDPAPARLVDKLPLNLIDLAFIRRVFPEAKVLVALRDPRDACLSCFMQSFALNESMVHFLALDSTARFYAAVMELWLHYRETLGLAALEYRYEDLVDDLSGTAASLLAFLDAPWDDAVLRYAETAGARHVSTPSYRDVTAPIYRRAVGRWRRYQREMAPVLPILEPMVGVLGYQP